MNFSSLTNLYSLSKTLRFELKPVGKTGELITKKDFFSKDESKAQAYPFLKDKMDAIHRSFIERCLQTINTLPITQEMMDDFLNKKDTKTYFKLLRGLISESFVDVKSLLDKTMIDKLLVSASDEEKKQIEQFQGFWGYFTTYTQNRANLYKNEDKAGQIAFRLIDENLPRFFKIKQILKDIQDKSPDFVVIEKNEHQQETYKKLTDYVDHFLLEKYHLYLSQAGIDACNSIIGYINHSINQYKQKTGTKYSFLPLLYKLPLAPRKVISRLPQQLENLDQVHSSVQSVIERLDIAIIPFVTKIFDDTQGYDQSGVYVSIKTTEVRGGIALTGWQSLRGLTHDISKNGEEAKLKKEKNDNGFPFVSLKEIAIYLDDLQTQGYEAETIFGDKIWIDKLKGQKHQYSSFSELFWNLIIEHISTIITTYHQYKAQYQLNISKDNTKHLLDSAMVIRRFVSGFDLMHKKKHVQAPDKDSSFYDGDAGLERLLRDENYPDPVHTIYDKVRNFLTKKPYNNDEKIKVNFDNPTLLDGRDQNKEKDNFGIILKENDKYFLAVMKKGKNTFFDEIKNKKLYDTDSTTMQKMIYKLLPGPNKMLPKVIFSDKNIKLFNPSSEILRIRKHETFKQGDLFSLSDLHVWIDFLKHALTVYDGRKHYSFSFKPTEQYEKINEFYHDVEKQGYEIKRKSIDKDTLMAGVDQELLYLFEITNKDFGLHTTGAKNMHTKYFEALFAGGQNNLFKMNGEAEIFWRKGKEIEQKEHRISPKHKIAITDKKRYINDKLMVHLPITLNFCRQENQFNKRVNSLIQSHPNNFTILGIDRGEKHLLYYSLIDQQGNIIKTGSRNTVGSKDTDYHAKLDQREKIRDQAQQDRDQQEQIKDLKAGYISQVIHEITKLVIDHNALIVLEDLNGGFKRSRQKVEKSVYQQFELALAKKLNYLVFKNIPDNQVGGVFNAYQLTPPVSQFQDLSFQTGVMLYTPAGYTSTTCPCCGWRKSLYLNYVNEKKAKEELSKLSITKSGDDFIISYRLESNKKGPKQQEANETITTHGQTRLQYNKEKKSTESYNMTQKFAEILGGLNYEDRLVKASAKQCKDLIRALNMLIKIRNAETGTDTDIISCPLCGFNSTQGFQNQEYNGDANGAYNIARKGILILNKIIAGEKSTMVKQDECDESWRK